MKLIAIKQPSSLLNGLRKGFNNSLAFS